jgi:hypothetical protein
MRSAPRRVARFAGLAAMSVLTALGAARAATYLVMPDGSGDLPTIQAAVQAAAPGDEILLGDGVFRGLGNRDVDLGGKALAIRSRSGQAGACVIDCQGSDVEPHRAFVCTPGLGGSSTFEALTITGGHVFGAAPAGCGGALRITGETAPAILDCVFEGCRATVGGAVYAAEAGPRFARCVFRGNAAVLGGGALAFAGGAHPTIEDCTFIANQADQGGGITAEWSMVTVSGCTFVRNRAWTGSGISAWLATLVVLERTILAFSALGRPVDCEDSTLWIECCDAYGNDVGDWIGCLGGYLGEDGNICADPLFCDLAGEDLRLDAGSPCLPSGECGRMGAWPVGCGGTPATVTSWGGLKARYRD